ncbi:MAG: glutathionylspermidine synthase family protein [Lysobacteraceae bacterium]|nr:MAG: glutathionylspermidine synthase family protein [Xanthomonadaceae bacterium]
MERRRCAPRADWQARLEGIGFDFHSMGGSYWVEDAYYAFTEAEVDRIEAAIEELHAMCMQLVAETVERGAYDGFGLTVAAIERVEASWRGREPALYGRMDLAYAGHGDVTLLEYNADTPTSLFEASVVQWHWLEETGLMPDQFNSLHEALVERWKQVLADARLIHFSACMDSAEDLRTVDYLSDTCIQAGFETRLLDIADIGWRGGFVGLQDEPVTHVFKLYPWEWMMAEPFSEKLPQARTRWIEPAWKQLLSNKSLLPALWRRFPNHPNLLPASHDPRDLAGPVVAKPRFGREGEGVYIAEHGVDRARADFVYQRWTPLFRHEGRHALLGGWVVGDRAVGLGIREDGDAITRNTSCFVPHGFS